MPSQIIHVLAGRAAVIGSDCDSAARYPGIFGLGCQGPDIFSHNRRTKPSSIQFARLLHRHDFGLFCAHFARICDFNALPQARAWFAGFVTHRAVDCAFHPYIVYHSFVAGQTGLPGVPPERFHVFLERILDALVYERLCLSPVASFDCEREISMDDDSVSILSSLISRALVLTYPQDAANVVDLELRVRNAFYDTLHFYRLTNPSCVTMEKPPDSERRLIFADCGVAEVALLHPEGIGSPDPYLNLAAAAWRDPASGLESRRSVFEIFDSAVSEARKAIDCSVRAMENGSEADSLELVAGNGALSSSDGDGPPSRVRFSRAFDLGPVLIDQAEKRRRWLLSAIS